MEHDGMPSNLLISIIDDDDSAREAIASLVRAFGFMAAEFRSAADFLKSDHPARTDCLIVDVQMPGMTGLQLHRHLSTSDTPIPTILITAYADEATRVRAREVGIQCYLAKPLDPDRLLDCIRSALVHRNSC
jgi:FixJ family two-component response regulator